MVCARQMVFRGLLVLGALVALSDVARAQAVTDTDPSAASTTVTVSATLDSSVTLTVRGNDNTAFPGGVAGTTGTIDFGAVTMQGGIPGAPGPNRSEYIHTNPDDSLTLVAHLMVEVVFSGHNAVTVALSGPNTLAEGYWACAADSSTIQWDISGQFNPQTLLATTGSPNCNTFTTPGVESPYDLDLGLHLPAGADTGSHSVTYTITATGS